jgi:hypothetical protein
VSVWRWIAVVLVVWAAPPIIARAARAIALRERRKRECQHLLSRVQAMLQAEFPDEIETVDSPTTPFSWFTDPELSNALVAPGVFAYVIPEGKVRKKDLEYVARYGGVLGSPDLRIYTHDPVPPDATEVTVDHKVVSIRGVSDCSCGRGAN